MKPTSFSCILCLVLFLSAPAQSAEHEQEIAAANADAVLLEDDPVILEESPDQRAGRLAVSVQGGTLGVGGSVWYSFNEYFSASAGYDWLGFGADVDTNDVAYDGDLNLSNVSLFLNWHPFKGTFRVIAGVVIQDNYVDVTGEPAGGTTFTINGTDYTAAEVGTLSGKGEFDNTVAPYLGIGWSKASVSTGFGFFADIGVMFSGSASASLSASGPISADPTFQQNLVAEQDDLNDEIDDYQIYPVFRLGAMYRF